MERAALTAQGAFAEAERGLRLAQDEVNAGLGPEHEKTRRVAGFLIELYDAWHAVEPDVGHNAQSAGWRAKLPPENEYEKAP